MLTITKGGEVGKAKRLMGLLKEFSSRLKNRKFLCDDPLTLNIIEESYIAILQVDLDPTYLPSVIYANLDLERKSSLFSLDVH